MIRRLRYFALVFFLLAPCAARCEDLPVIDNTLIDAFTNLLDKALFVTGWGYDPATDSWGEIKDSVFLVGRYPNYSIGDYLYSVGNYLGLTAGTGVTRLDVWRYLEQNQYGYIVYDVGSDPSFQWTVDNPPNSVQDVPGLFDWILSASLADPLGSDFNFFGNPFESVFGLAQAANTLFPKLNDALDKINQGGGGGGGSDPAVSNIVEILNDQFGRSSGQFSFVSNSFVSVSASVSSLTNQLGSALVLLNGGFSNVVDMLNSGFEQCSDRAGVFSNQIDSVIRLLDGCLSNVVSLAQDRASALSGVTNRLDAVIDVLDSGISNILSATASDFTNRYVVLSGITNQLDDVINLLRDMPTNIVDNLSNHFDSVLDRIDLNVQMGPTNIIRILTNHFGRVTNHFDVVSNSLSEISGNVGVVTNQIEIALDLLNQIASNTQQQVQIEILEWMTNDWPSLSFGFPDKLTNAVEDITNNLGVSFYGFHAQSGPQVWNDWNGVDDFSERWRYATDDQGRYYLDSFFYDIRDLQEGINDGSWQFGDVVTYCIQGILDKAQDIKNSLWILNHSFDTNSANVDISELDNYKREVDSFVKGTQSSLESAFYSVELDAGVFGRFKDNFVAIFGTVGKGPPLLRAASGSSNRRTVWTFYVGDQQWDISLDSTLYTSSRRLCRMAASMVWCCLLWLAFRKILIRAIYFLVKCMDWCFQVFGFQIKWLATIEEFLANVAGVGPGGS